MSWARRPPAATVPPSVSEISTVRLYRALLKGARVYPTKNRAKLVEEIKAGEYIFVFTIINSMLRTRDTFPEPKFL